MKKDKEVSYCVMGTSVRTGRRCEVTNDQVFMTRSEAAKVLGILLHCWSELVNKEYTMKDMTVERRPGEGININLKKK